MLKIFKKGYKTLTTDTDVWVVRWYRKTGEYSFDYEEMAQFFISKEEAKEFADSLNRANKLLGHKCSKLTRIKCEKVVNKGL